MSSISAQNPDRASSRNPGLDTLRSVAILTVMVFHTFELHPQNTIPERLLPVAQLCWMGVDLFFVLSGYLIGLQVLRPYSRGARPSISTFYLKRFFRVLPAYLVVYMVYCTIPAWREVPHMAPPWQFLTFTWNFFANYPTDKAFSHVWSLCVEEHFYLLLPLIVVLMARRPSLRKSIALIALVLLAGVVFRSYVVYHWLQPLAAAGRSYTRVYVKQIYYPTYSRLDGLLGGVCLALIRLFRPAWWSRLACHGHLTLLSGSAFVASAVVLFHDRWQSVTGVSALGTMIGFPVLSLGLALVVLSALSTNGLLARGRVPGAEVLATLAYSLYLTHKGIIHIDSVYFPRISGEGGVAWVGLFAVTSLATAAILYVGVERPFLKLRDRLISEPRISVTAEVASEPAI